MEWIIVSLASLLAGGNGLRRTRRWLALALVPALGLAVLHVAITAAVAR